MSKKLRVIFMGTPEFAVENLRAIVASQHDVVAVVTVPDKPAGRGLKLTASPVKDFANQHNIPVLQPEKLRNEDFITQLKSFDADVAVVVAFRMLPKAVWQLPRFGTFNLHASLLPQYRGAAPINWAIINGEKQTGVTTFFIDDKIDTGAVILQAHTSIDERETAGTLHDKLMLQGGQLVVQTLDAIAEGNGKPIPQPTDKELFDAPKLFKETCRIDWKHGGANIERLIRGLSPYPAAWTELVRNGKSTVIKIYDAIYKQATHDLPLGTPKIEGKTLSIAVCDGFLEILELQISGKKRMKTNDLLNGFGFEKGDLFV